MSKRDYSLYIEDIIECIEKVKAYKQGMNFIEFADDSKTMDAVIRKLEVIGEASRQLSDEFKNKYPNIDWKAIIGFRNVIIHEYFGINIRIIWDIIENELPILYAQIKEISSC